LAIFHWKRTCQFDIIPVDVNKGVSQKPNNLKKRGGFSER